MKQKTLGIIGVCLLIQASISHAQVKLNVGIKAGMNIAKLQSEFSKEENRLGYQAGLWVRVKTTGFYVQPEAYFGSKGGKFTNIKIDATTIEIPEAKINFSTLDIPLLFGTQIGSKSLNIRFMGGPIMSLIVDKQISSSSTYNQAVSSFSDYKNQTWGGQVGAGVDVGNISVDLRYEKGFSNISKSGKYDQKQNLWHISLGFKVF